ncbi:MAG: hypothetical protein AB7G44_07060 [Bacteroidia bacterium]
MSFIKPKTTVSFTLSLEKEKADKVATILKNIAEHASIEELQLLEKVVTNPVYKNLAVAELKKRLN